MIGLLLVCGHAGMAFYSSIRGNELGDELNEKQIMFQYIYGNSGAREQLTYNAPAGSTH